MYTFPSVGYRLTIETIIQLCTSFIIRHCFLHLFPHVVGIIHQKPQVKNTDFLCGYDICLPGITSFKKKYKVHHVYSLCIQMYVSFPLAGFDTSESATHFTHIYLKSCEKNKLGSNVSCENQQLPKRSLTIFTNP